MIVKWKVAIVAGILSIGLLGGLMNLTALSDQAVAAGPGACDTSGGFLGIPAWYNGLTDGNCNIQNPDSVGGISTFIWKIVLNVLGIILRVISYIAVIFIVYGGFLYLTSSGNAENIARALKTIMNASVGFAISLSAFAIQNFISSSLIGSYATDPETGIGGLVKQNAGEILIGGLNAAYFIAGAIAVVMIIIAGLSYVTSSGDSGKVVKAKNTILYAVIGLAVIIFAFAITSFISSRL
jgi:hypothetical protein